MNIKENIINKADIEMKLVDPQKFPLPVQWNPSCEANPFMPEMSPFKKGNLLSRVKIQYIYVQINIEIWPF